MKNKIAFSHIELLNQSQIDDVAKAASLLDYIYYNESKDTIYMVELYFHNSFNNFSVANAPTETSNWCYKLFKASSLEEILLLADEIPDNMDPALLAQAWDTSYSYIAEKLPFTLTLANKSVYSSLASGIPSLKADLFRLKQQGNWEIDEVKEIFKQYIIESVPRKVLCGKNLAKHLNLTAPKVILE